MDSKTKESMMIRARGNEEIRRNRARMAALAEAKKDLEQAKPAARKAR